MARPADRPQADSQQEPKTAPPGEDQPMTRPILNRLRASIALLPLAVALATVAGPAQLAHAADHTITLTPTDAVWEGERFKKDPYGLDDSCTVSNDQLATLLDGSALRVGYTQGGAIEQSRQLIVGDGATIVQPVWILLEPLAFPNRVGWSERDRVVRGMRQLCGTGHRREGNRQR